MAAPWRRLGVALWLVSAPVYFHVGKGSDGRWWLIDPQGKAFYSTGVDQTEPNGDVEAITGRQPYRDAMLRIYGDAAHWAEAVMKRLGDWGFNTIGAWSQDDLFRARMPYTVLVGCRAYLPGPGIGDFFSPEFSAAAEAAAENAAVAADGTARATDPNLIGYFLDNEMDFGRDYRTFHSAFVDAFEMPGSAPGKQALVALLEERYGGRIDRLNAAWGSRFKDFAQLAAAREVPHQAGGKAEYQADESEFLFRMARQYYSVCSDAIRRHDHVHLLLGNRYISNFTSVRVLEAAAETQDVISVNFYRFTDISKLVVPLMRYPDSLADETDWLASYSRLAGDRPVLVSEFSSRAWSWRTPDIFPLLIFPSESSQNARVAQIQTYIERTIEAPYIIGYHYYEWVDEPLLGRRGDLENSNWGLVNENDQPYAKLVSAFTTLNSRATRMADGVSFPAGAEPLRYLPP